MKSQMPETLNSILSRIQQNLSDGRTQKFYKTGFEKFDKHYFGLAPKEFWVVGGYTGAGKSFFLLQLMINLIKQGVSVAFFSLEMSKESLVSRMWANISGISPAKLEYGLLEKSDFEKKEKAAEELEQYGDDAYLIDDQYKLRDIKETIETLRPKVVMIDYLQNLQDTVDEYQKLTAASAVIQQIAKQYDCAVIAASQISNTEARAGSSSEIIGFKGSGGIAAAADFGLQLDNVISGQINHDDKGNKPIRLAVRKSRRGVQKKMSMILKFPSGRLEENE